MSNSKRAPVGTNSIFDEPAVAEITNIKTKKRLKDGRVMVPFVVAAPGRDQLRLMALENNTTQQELLVLALNQFFEKHGKPPVA